MQAYVRAETKWERARLGKFTASEIDKLFTPARCRADRKAGKLGGTANSYITSRAAELTTGLVRQFSTWAMEWGNSYEPMAAGRLAELFPGMEYYGKKNPCFITLTDFSGASLDCWYGARNMVIEIKCPANPENHIENCLLTSQTELKAKRRGYYRQIQMGMICKANELGIAFKEMRGAFVSFCPIVNEPFQDLKILEIEPDMEFFEELPKVLARAEEELSEIMWVMSCGNLTGLQVTHDPATDTTVIQDVSEIINAQH